MALKQLYSAQGEIPTGLREHYTEQDGQWMLQTDPPTEDVTGLKTALDKERGRRRDAERQLTETRSRFEGIDPDEVARLRERVKGFDEQDIHDKTSFEAQVAKRTQGIKDEYTRLLTAKERENVQLKTTVADLDRKRREEKLTMALTTAATKAGCAPAALDDAVRRGLAVFTELDERDLPLAKQGDEIRYGKNGVDPLSPDEWLLGLKPTAPHLWPPSSGGGAPPYHQGNGTGIDYAALPPTERLTKWREQQAAGRTS